MPRPVAWLQGAGLILTPARHARHHTASHAGAYCVTTGWLNPLLDRLQAFAAAEREKAMNLQRIRLPALHAKYAARAMASVREFRNKGYCWNVGYRLGDRVNVAAALHRRLDGELVIFNCTVLARSSTPVEEEAARLGPLLLQMLRRVESAAGIEQV